MIKVPKVTGHCAGTKKDGWAWHVKAKGSLLGK